MGDRIEKHVGQLFMVGFHGTVVPDELLNLIEKQFLGGMILFKRNLEEPHQIAGLSKAVQAYAGKCDVPPLFNAVDQEGGVVARLGPPYTVFPSQGDLDENTAYDDCFQRGAAMAKDILQAGFNMNLAPVLDIRKHNDTSKTGRRSFSSDPHRVASLGMGIIHGLQENGVAACAKHFPGLGKANKDPHEELPRVADDISMDLIPFRAAIAQRVAAVMIGHAEYTSLDPGKQATVSAKIVTDLLRTTMGYKGLILSDDLEMGAIINQYSLPEAAVLSFEAGCDILLVCSRLEEVNLCIETLRREIEKSAFLRERMRESAARTAEVKQAYLAVR